MTIYSQAQEVAIERISKKNSHICVIGVGTIGLPLATFLAKNGFSVKGLDVNEQRVNEINSGNTIYEYQNDLKTLVNGKKLVVTTDVKVALEKAEIIFICVPTPLNKNNEMDIFNLTEVAKRIKDHLKNYSFKGVSFTLQSLKIKKSFLDGDKIAALQEIIKSPFNFKKYKFLILFFIPRKKITSFINY